MKKSKNADVCIIGGGVSGIAAAIAARMKDPQASICLIEKKDKIGKKLLATGNGRCNFTNINCETSNEILSFFNMLGIKERVEEQGRVYPYSGKAKDVLHALESYINANNIKVYKEFEVENLRINAGKSTDVLSGNKKISALKVLIATGGKAGPQFGCIGDGYKLAREMGHTVTKLLPALSPVECEGEFTKLKGIRVKAKVTLVKNEKVLSTEIGELQFTEYGLSGICILNLSRYIRLEAGKFADYEISADLLYDMNADELEQELKSRKSNNNIMPDNLLVSIVPEELASFVLSKVNNKEDIKKLAHLLKNLTFTVSGVKGWKFAQCTSGGIPIAEVDINTMESKIIKGLYFAGEIIDYDGPCGGFNLNNAWETGIKAGKAMVTSV